MKLNLKAPTLSLPKPVLNLVNKSFGPKMNPKTLAATKSKNYG